MTVQPTANYFVGTPGSASVTIHDDTPYNSTWVSQFPGFNGASAAPDLDLERDGISNFGEFVFNGNPFVVRPFHPSRLEHDDFARPG